MGGRDTEALTRFLAAHPVERVFVAARVEAMGIHRLGCPLWGWFDDGDLVSVCHHGANLMPMGADEQILDAFADRVVAARRGSASIVGEAAEVMGLFHRLVDRDELWADPRDVRPCQPMLAIDTDPQIVGDERVQPVTMADFGAYVQASMEMYREEVGVSPVAQGAQGYFAHVRTLIETGRAFGIIESGRVVFKADLGATAGEVAQIQGVWVDPEFRGRGLSAPAMAQVVRLARRRHRVISLYVNDYNLPARACYARCGFEQVGEFATVLY